MENIIIAIVSGLIGGIPALVGNIMSNRKSTALMEYKIDKLDEKVHQHNNLIDRMYKAEEKISIIEEKIK